MNIVRIYMHDAIEDALECMPLPINFVAFFYHNLHFASFRDSIAKLRKPFSYNGNIEFI